nr:hypothetical protein [Tanacetum cinerariifolium]
MLPSKRKNVLSKRKNVFVEEKRMFSSKKNRCFRRREKESVLTYVVKSLELGFSNMTFNVCDRKLKVLDINTEAFTSGLDDGMAAENGRVGECLKKEKEAATMASSSKPKLSFGDLDLTNISDSDEEEVFASNEEFAAYLSSVGDGNQLEEEFDFYDDDYADQIRDLPGQLKAFRDF